MCVQHCGDILNTVGDILSTLVDLLGTVGDLQYYRHPSPGTEHIFYRMKISIKNIHGFFHKKASVTWPYKMSVHYSGSCAKQQGAQVIAHYQYCRNSVQ